jgi:hypothetical protein
MGKIKARGLKNIKFVKGDYMKTSHSDMDLIMCYVLKVTGEPLGKKLAKEIKDDCVVISEMFPLGHLDEVKQIESSIYGVPEKIFVYKKPANAVKKDTVKTTKKTATKKTTTAKKTVAKAKTTAEKTRTAKGKK